MVNTRSNENGENSAGGRNAHMEDLLRALANYAHQYPAPANHPAEGSWSHVMDRFQRLRPPTFCGQANHEEAELWLERIEKVLDHVGCNEVDRVKLAQYVLEGEANDWWKATKLALQVPVAGIPWKTFKDQFLERYFPQTVRSGLTSEFVNLRQGGMTVAEYATKFSKLSKFAPYLVATPELRASKFEEGLRQSIKNQVTRFELKDYNKIYARALKAETLQRETERSRPTQYQQGTSSGVKR